MTPHEQVARAIAVVCSGEEDEYGFHGEEATAVIEALREGAADRIYANLFDGTRGGMLTIKVDDLVAEVVEAVFGESEAVNAQDQ